MAQAPGLVAVVRRSAEGGESESRDVADEARGALEGLARVRTTTGQGVGVPSGFPETEAEILAWVRAKDLDVLVDALREHG